MNDDEIYNKFMESAKTVREHMRKCILLLPEIERRKIWRKKGFTSIFQFAYRVVGMNENQVREALCLVKKIENKPLLKKVVEEKGLSRVKALRSLIDTEPEKELAKLANNMSQKELEIVVREMKETESGVRIRMIAMHLSKDLADKLETWCDGNWESLMNEFVKLKEANMKKPPIKRGGSRAVPRGMKKYIMARAAGKCEIPGCTRKCCELHHKDRWSEHHVHDVERILALCAGHHKLAHQEDHDVQFYRRV